MSYQSSLVNCNFLISIVALLGAVSSLDVIQVGLQEQVVATIENSSINQAMKSTKIQKQGDKKKVKTYSQLDKKKIENQTTSAKNFLIQ